MTQEKSYCGPWRRLYHWGLRGPCPEDPKEIPINKKPKADTVTVKPIENSINEDAQEFQDPQWLSRFKLTLFGFLVMVYDISSHLKIEAKVFFV